MAHPKDEEYREHARKHKTHEHTDEQTSEKSPTDTPEQKGKLTTGTRKKSTSAITK